MRVSARACAGRLILATAHVWRQEDRFLESVLSLHLVLRTISSIVFASVLCTPGLLVCEFPTNSPSLSPVSLEEFWNLRCVPWPLALYMSSGNPVQVSRLPEQLFHLLSRLSGPLLPPELRTAVQCSCMYCGA